MATETTDTPTRVVLFSYASGEPQAVAEFRWSPETGVVLTVIDPVQGKLAQRYHDDGVPFEAERRLVAASEGPIFMQALVQPSRTSYTRFIDKSQPDEQG